jgi:hypothetical protein
MKTITELEEDIQNISKHISTEYPELAKHILEIIPPKDLNDRSDPDYKKLRLRYNLLVKLLEEHYTKISALSESTLLEQINFSEYPVYPPSEDIYTQSKEESDIDPEHTSKLKKPCEKLGLMNEKIFEEDMSGDDLDIPGSEEDDLQESIGSEDEENNYYSLGDDSDNATKEEK